MGHSDLSRVPAYIPAPQGVMDPVEASEKETSGLRGQISKYRITVPPASIGTSTAKGHSGLKYFRQESLLYKRPVALPSTLAGNPSPF